MRIQLSIAAALASVALVPLAGQTRSAIPRLADGHPDLQDTYDLAMLTPVERAAGSPLVLADEEVKKLERQAAARKGHLGLRLLTEAVRDAGGTVEVITAPDAGTTVRIIVVAS